MKKIFIAGSSRNNIDDKYYHETETLAKHLKNKDIALIVGCDKGLIKKIIDVSSNKNVEVIEVEAYLEDNYRFPMRLNNLISKRKQILIDEASILLFLPGGIGSLDELFTALESKRAGEHNKEIIIVNYKHYYDDILNMLEKMSREKFINNTDNSLYKVFTNNKDLIKYLISLEL